MTSDLVRYAEQGIVVPTAELLGLARTPEMLPDPRLKKVRRRPNKGRIKRTNRTPGLDEPPWGMLASLNIYVPPTLQNLPITPFNWRRGGDYLRWKAGVFRQWGYTCHLCGHGEAYSADHLIPLSVWSNQPYDVNLARPAHGVVQPDKTEGCPTCHVKCNSSRGNRALANQILNYKPTVEL